MAQFDIIRNLGGSRAEVPYLLILQDDVLSELQTRIVAPLRNKSTLSGSGITRIQPDIEVQGVSFRIFLSELAAVSSVHLGEVVMNISNMRTEIVSALDLIFTGF